MSRRKPKQKPVRNSAPPLARRKLIYFRLLALVGVPLLLLGLLEVGLRVTGFGYPTAFLLKSSNHGQSTFVQNNLFGWRFFGPRAARQPFAISIPREKPSETIRVFVFGESAAYGDPQPRFGLPRMLEAMLEMRHPDKKFEVVNAAMTGINSHVVRSLARDCTSAGADVWVIYMGNNEVVGPFGAGTVFGGQTTPLSLIHAGLALKATRIGQLFGALQRAAQKNSAGAGDWDGMRAFVKYKVAKSDSRLQAVYENFGKNLKDIIVGGQACGAKIVLSTVAVNLKECAPFASVHSPDLSETRLNEWQRFFDAGVKAQEKGDFREAAIQFEQAEQIDESFAELRFRRGQCLLESNKAAAARSEFSAARDCDALRFRSDSRLNEIIRQQTVNGVSLADAEHVFAENSADGIPGDQWFLEHVHLTFQGNYLLARSIAEKVEESLKLSQGAPWPEISGCAQRLGYTARDTQLALSDIRGRLTDVPFTFQFNHEEQMHRLSEAARQLPLPNSAETLREAHAAVEAALTRRSEDPLLWEQLAEISQQQGDLAGAAVAAQKSLNQLPSNAACWQLKGILLAQAGNLEEALAAFKQVFTLDPQAVWARHNFALCLEKLGRRGEALVEFKHALALKPNYGTSWLALGQLYEEMGRTNDAGQCFDRALTNRVNQAEDMATLARFCVSRRWLDLAVTNFAAAIELSPSDVSLRMEAGRVMAATGRHEEAMLQYQAAVELNPDEAQPRLQLGVELGRLWKPDLAEKEFREALRLDPNLIQARVNLGVALYRQQKLEEARNQFEEVLKLNPNDPNALRYIQELRNASSKTNP